MSILKQKEDLGHNNQPFFFLNLSYLDFSTQAYCCLTNANLEGASYAAEQNACSSIMSSSQQQTS